MSVQVRLLGTFAVNGSDGATLHFRSDKVRALLAYLASEADRPHQRAHLAALLWPDQPDKMALRNLSQTLVRLREALDDARADPPVLLLTRQTVQWNPRRVAEIDVALFTGQARSAGAVERQRTVELYRGPFLNGFSLSGCPEFEAWLLLTREYLERIALETLDALAQTYLTTGRYWEAGEAAQRQLGIDPWREAAYRQLMEALAAAGDRVGALTQYERCRQALRDELGVEPDDLTVALAEQIRDAERTPAVAVPQALPQHEWDDAPNLTTFYGREEELTTISAWMADAECRLVAVTGIGGTGKTALVAQAARRAVGQFELTIWRSLLNAPPLSELLHIILATLSARRFVPLPETDEAKVALLLDYLRQRRCLLVLDNLESLLEGGASGPRYRPEYEGYGRLLLRLGQAHHGGCVVITSREAPPEFTRLLGLTGHQGPTRTLALRGLTLAASLKLLQVNGLFGADAVALAQHYSGHPLALQLVAGVVRDLYGGDSAAFLDEDVPVFESVRVVLDNQFARLSTLEQELLLWLAISREPTTPRVLAADLVQSPSRAALVEALRNLQHYSLVELHAGTIALQNVVTEYLTGRLVERFVSELSSGDLDWAVRFAVLKTNVKDYVRQSQVRVIALPIARRLARAFGIEGLHAQFGRLLDVLRQRPRAPSYAAGNLLNLWRALGGDLRSLDCSHLCVWQVDLRDIEAQKINFANADFANAVFSDTFASITSVAFTPDGQRLLAGCADATLRIWSITDGQPLAVLYGHTGVVWALALSPDGRWCASCSDDWTVRLWDLSSGRAGHLLRGHTNVVESIAFSPDGGLLASGGQDKTVRLWDVASGELLRTLDDFPEVVFTLDFLHGAAGELQLVCGGMNTAIGVWDLNTGKLLRQLEAHAQSLRCLSVSPDGSTLVSGSREPELRLWDTRTWQVRHTLSGHSAMPSAVAFSPDGASVASASYDQTVRLWDATTGSLRRTLTGHTGWVHGVAFSADAALLASGSADQTVRVWESRTGQLLRVLSGHINWVPALAFTAGGERLVSGNWDNTVRIWDPDSAQLQHTLRGHTAWVGVVVCSPDGLLVASGASDGHLCIWELASGRLRYRLSGHEGGISGIAFHPEVRWLASSGYDGTVRVWDLRGGQELRKLAGHTDSVLDVAFSPDGHSLVSGSRDRTLRQWSVATWQHVHTLESPQPGGRIWSLAFSPNGELLAVGHNDGPIDLWDWTRGEHRIRLTGHTALVGKVAFTPDGTSLASCSDDTTVRIWDVATGQERQVWAAHPIRTMALAFRPGVSGAPPLLATGGCDDLVKLWDSTNGSCLRTLCASRLYDGMRITGATGLSKAQMQALGALGAVDEGSVRRTENQPQAMSALAAGSGGFLLRSGSSEGERATSS